MPALEDRQSENAEDRQGGNLDQDENRVEARALLGADNQQDRHQRGDHRRRQVEDPAAERTRGERSRNDDPPALHEPHEIAGPADRHGACADGIFEDQRPADHPGKQLAHDGIGVSVSRAGDRDHRGKLGIAQRSNRADGARNDEADHHRRTGLLSGFGGQHENAGADDGADAEQRQLERAERAMETLLLSGGQNRIERLHPAKKQASLRCYSGHHSPLSINSWRDPNGWRAEGNPISTTSQAGG